MLMRCVPTLTRWADAFPASDDYRDHHEREPEEHHGPDDDHGRLRSWRRHRGATLLVAATLVLLPASANARVVSSDGARHRLARQEVRGDGLVRNARPYVGARVPVVHMGGGLRRPRPRPPPEMGATNQIRRSIAWPDSLENAIRLQQQLARKRAVPIAARTAGEGG